MWLSLPPYTSLRWSRWRLKPMWRRSPQLSLTTTGTWVGLTIVTKWLPTSPQWKLSFHLVTLTLVQPHYLYQKVRKQIGKPGMPLDEFIISVGGDLVTMPKPRRNEEQPPPTGAAVPQTQDHLHLQGMHVAHFFVPLKGTRGLPDKKPCCPGSTFVATRNSVGRSKRRGG